MRYEFRWLGANQAVDNKSFVYGGDFSTTTFKMRYRNQLKVTIPLNHKKMDDKTVYLQASEELFINIGEKVANINLLDQNRILLGLGYKFNKFYALEAGYLKQSIFRFNNTAKDNEDINNVFQVNLAVSNLDQIFNNKK